MLEKIKTLGQLKQIASEAKANGRKVVLAHGVFDILHVGHKGTSTSANGMVMF